MAVRMLYTRYARSHDKTGLSGASNATPPAYDETPSHTEAEKDVEEDIIEKNGTLTATSSTHTSTEELTQSTPHLNAPIAVFPQYLSKTTTTLTIREVGFPNFSDSFTVSNGSEQIFNVHRERPTIGWRQHITDAHTNAPVMTIRRNLGQLPVSYRFEDPAGAKVVDLRGNFFLPHTGAKSSAFLLNSETGEKTELAMRGSYRNRHATITNKATGEVLVEMKSNIFEVRNVVGSRRTYEVTVRAGMDLVLAVGMIIALDARAD